MLKRVYLIILLFTLIIISVGCKSANSSGLNGELDSSNENESVDLDTTSEEVVIIEDPKESLEVDKNLQENVNTEVDTEVNTELVKDGEVQSKLSGLFFPKEKLSGRPIAVMIDNQYYARPQSGLSDAEIIYEILAEGLITRYMAIFYANEPDMVGPIRSARPYFINRALEFDSMYAHVGGSPQAWADLVNLNVADLDGMSGNGMYRTKVTNKKPPHNTYSSIEALKKSAENRNYRLKGEFEFFKFYDNEKILDNSENANYLKVIYKKPTNNDKTGYYIEFKFDKDTNQYYRYVNGNQHLDEANDEPLTAKNIIVQFVEHKVIDDVGRLRIKDVGQGEAYLITMGSKIKLTWSKKNRESMTKFYDKDGKLIELNKGVTWIEVVPLNTMIGW